ncbi:MAG: transglutaminase domain-containing protein [Gemmatimonadaceae bacterium]
MGRPKRSADDGSAPCTAVLAGTLKRTRRADCPTHMRSFFLTSGGRSLCAALAVASLAALPATAQTNATSEAPNIHALADSVGGPGSTMTRTRNLVYWINDSFTWSYTDYEKRTPVQIIARRAGNCAELASVLHLMLDSLNVRTRWVREINVQPGQTPRRQATADSLVKLRGNSFSVFGLQHNDHVWLEVWDDSSGAWFPADPAYGVVGLKAWSAARLAMDHRPKPRVKAVEPIAADMVVPFVVSAGDRRSGPYTEDRTQFYLIDGFNALYDSRLSSLPSWPAWVGAVQALSPHAQAAFDGKENLHEHTAEIGALKQTYDRLTREAAANKLTWQ